MRTEIKVRGDKDVLRRLYLMRRRARDARPIWPKFLLQVRLHNEEVFIRQGSGGRKWKPLSPPYARWKYARVGPMPILQFSGALKDSVTGTSMDIERMGRRRVEWGSRDRKAAWHQFGTDRNGRPHMPARPFLTIDRRLLAKGRELMVEHITEPWNDL